MELAGITGPGTALIAGLVTSLHCAGMCGPLACAVMPGGGERVDARTVASAYHVARLVSYTALGALAGGIGSAPLQWIAEPALKYLPWLLVVFFVALAVRFDRRLPRLAWLGRAYHGIAARIRGRNRLAAAGALGAATPLLPCGPLYFVAALGLFSGSAARGAETMLAFGIGTVPLLWLAQTNFAWLRRRLGPTNLARLQTTLAVLTASVIAWRLRATLGFPGPDPFNFVCH